MKAFVFTFSKILGPLSDPRVIAFFVLIVGTLLLWTKRRRLGRVVVTATVGVALVLAVVPIGVWSLTALEQRFPAGDLPSRIDGVIVLGGDFDPRLVSQRGGLSLGQLGGARLVAFARLAREHPEARLVFSGGSGRLLDQETKEAAAAAIVLDALGLDTKRVRFEDQSRDTFENAELSLPIADPRPGETWVLITAASHMARAIGCFRKAGWLAAGARLVPYPVDYWTTITRGYSGVDFRFEGGMRYLARAGHEWAGLLVYYLSGRTDALFPAP
jgi:uncharacterized SAM-binding protein YcdF (DUF218 family)